jgi:hypothetical protein
VYAGRVAPAKGDAVRIRWLLSQCRSAVSIVALALGIAYSAPGTATSFSYDQSDLWWLSSESGWGMQLVQRGQVMFATLFVYDSNNRPVWYTATVMPTGDGTWAGDLYATTGPWFGAATFDPNAVTLQKVGTLTWATVDSTTGTLTYAVNTTAVTKRVERQLLVYDDYSGHYAAALSWVNSCTGLHEQYADLVVTQVNQNVSVNWTTLNNTSCSFAGTLSQAGQFGRVAGTFECFPVHDDGQFTFYELIAGKQSLSGRFSSLDEDSGCSNDGYFSAARRR